MTDQGPTTVGSIVGKLRLDRAAWVAEMAATKADIREIEGSNPDIHIGTNAASVIAQLEAAAAAADEVGASAGRAGVAQRPLTAAFSESEVAARRVQIAQMRLDELRERGITTGSRYAAAELALSEAMRKTGDNTIVANEANKTSVSRVGAITTAVALLLPLLSPVAAAAVGIAGAMAGMGAAGVLAIIGIRNEMQAGTAVGSQYRAGFDSLKGSLDGLSHTAAVAMLSSFQRVIRDTQAAMPMLNSQVGQLSSLLGQSGANLFSGTITSLRVLNPLFQTAGLYLRSLTQGFQDWTQSGGLQQFGAYAITVLPQVTDVLGKLASMVMHILEALAPLGQVGLAVLSGISTVINAIPVQILSDLIVTVTWGAIAFKAWGFVAPLLSSIASAMGAVGVATEIATGPIGWVVAGLSALAGIFAVTIAANTGATRAMQDYTAAVQADSGAIGENVRQKVAQKLLDDGALDIAKKLGIATSLVVDATLGNADARRQLNAQLQAGQISSTAITTAVDKESQAVAGAVDQYNTLNEAVEQTTTAKTYQAAADEAAAAALGISASAIQQARSGQDDLKSSTENATAQMYLQNDAAGLLKSSLDLLNGKTLDNAEAQNRFDSTLANMGAHIDKTGKDVNRATASLDGMSAAAVANRGELISSVQAAQQSAEAFRDNGGSAADARQKLLDMRQAIIDHAVSVGEDKGQVEQFIDSIFQIPASVPPTKIEVDAANAQAQVDAIKRSLATIARNIDVAVNLHGAGNLATQSGTKVSFAGGGTIPGLAAGGVGGTVYGPGTAGSDTAGVFRLAHGEEVISNVFGQASKNRALLKQINAGYTPAQHTAPSGASASPTSTASGGDIHVTVQVTTVQNEDPNVLGNIIGRGVKQALAGVVLR